MWKDIKNFEGLYQVNELGEVKALKREITRTDGKVYTYPEMILKKCYNDRTTYY